MKTISAFLASHVRCTRLPCGAHEGCAVTRSSCGACGECAVARLFVRSAQCPEGAPLRLLSFKFHLFIFFLSSSHSPLPPSSSCVSSLSSSLMRILFTGTPFFLFLLLSHDSTTDIPQTSHGMASDFDPHKPLWSVRHTVRPHTYRAGCTSDRAGRTSIRAVRIPYM